MANYTFYVLETDGYLVGGTAIDCADDDEALARAKELLGTFNAAVEVWDGARKVWSIGTPRDFSDAAHLNRN
jgi:hypothetical protein